MEFFHPMGGGLGGGIRRDCPCASYNYGVYDTINVFIITN